MSSIDSTTPEVVIEDVDVEDFAPVSSIRRALEVGSFVFALASLVLFAYYLTYAYASNKAQAAQGAEGLDFSAFMELSQGLVTQQSYAFVAFSLVSVVLAAVVRGIYNNDERSHDRTVISITISVILAVWAVFIAIYTSANGVFGETSPLGETSEARLTYLISNIVSLIIAIGTLIIAAIFMFGRSDAAELETEDELSVDEPVLAASNDEIPKI